MAAWGMPLRTPHLWTRWAWLGVCMGTWPLLSELAFVLAPVFIVFVTASHLAPFAYVIEVLWWQRRSATWLTGLLLALASVVAVLIALPWLSYFPNVLASFGAQSALAIVPLLALVLAAERAVAYGSIAARDRVLAVTVGFLCATALSFGLWVVVLATAAVWLTLAVPATLLDRVLVAILAGMPALALSQLPFDVETNRVVEWVAWLAFVGATLVRIRRDHPPKGTRAIPSPASA